jgi:hypothetical protein
MTHAESTHQVLRWPANRFYWAIVEERNLRTHVRIGAASYLAEPIFPVPLEQLQVTAAPLDDGRVLVCGLDKSSLESVDRATVVALYPEQPPPMIEGVGNAAIGRLNMLRGCYLPRTIRTARFHLILIGAIALVAVATLLCTGLSNRTSHLMDQIARSRERIAETQRTVLGHSNNRHDQPPELRFTAELRRLQQTRSVPPIALADATATLQLLLACWPENLHTTTELMSITATSITVRFEIPSAELSALEESLQNLDGWQRQQPEITNRGDLAMIAIRFVLAQVEKDS